MCVTIYEPYISRVSIASPEKSFQKLLAERENGAMLFHVLCFECEVEQWRYTTVKIRSSFSHKSIYRQDQAAKAHITYDSWGAQQETNKQTATTKSNIIYRLLDTGVREKKKTWIKLRKYLICWTEKFNFFFMLSRT